MTTLAPATVPSVKKSAPGREWMIGAAIVLLALVARFVGLDRLEVWHDEACSVLTVTSPRGIWHELRLDTNAPLYFILLKAWVSFTGIGAWGIRSLSAVFGTLTVVVVGLWVKECGASRRSMWWAMGLCAVAPMQIYYSQEARPYALVCLLVALALWTFTRAMKRQRGIDWALHGLVIVAGAYTHNLFVPWVLGFWIFAAIARPSKRQWAGSFLTHAAAAIAFVPGALLLWGQVAHSGGTEWIVRFWNQMSHALVIPWSLEVLSTAGGPPDIIRWLPMDGFWRWTGVGLVAVAAAAALWPARQGARESAGGWWELGRFRWLLVVFTLWPLVDLWLYSVVRTPIYIVGRYDILAQPAYMALLAMGLSRLTRPDEKRRRMPAGMAVRWGMALLLVGMMASGAWRRVRLEMQMDPAYFQEKLRGEFLTNVVQPRDVVVCMMLEAAITSYYCQLHGVHCEIRTLPAETLAHIGWQEPAAYDERRLPQIRAQIEQLFHDAAAHGAPHIWIVIDMQTQFPWEGPPQRYVFDWITRMTFAAAAAHGWSLTPGSLELAKLVHLASLDPPRVAATGAAPAR